MPYVGKQNGQDCQIDFSLVAEVEVLHVSEGYANLFRLQNGAEIFSETYPCLEDAIYFKQLFERNRNTSHYSVLTHT